jgi:hypothetical protein
MLYFGLKTKEKEKEGRTPAGEREVRRWAGGRGSGQAGPRGGKEIEGRSWAERKDSRPT